MPSPAVMPTYQFEAAREKPYTPSVCSAGANDKMASPAKRQSAASACAKESEEYRLSTNDLIQQTRAADAAREQALIATQNLWLSYMQMIGGFLTLIAAGLAAFYAREAAKETRRSADAAHDDLAHSREVSELQMRPYVKFTAGNATLRTVLDETHPNRIGFGLHFFNVGETPAIDSTVKYFVRLKFPSGLHQNLFECRDWQRASTVVRGDQDQIFTTVALTDDEYEIFDNRGVEIECLGEMKYNDIYGMVHHHSFNVIFDAASESPVYNLENEVVYKIDTHTKGEQ